MTETVCADLIVAFENADLPRSQWTHEAHLRVGFYYASHFPIAIAGARLRDGIQRLNAANGIRTTPTGGYHETITLLYLALLADFYDRADKTWSHEEMTDAAVAALGARELPLEYYSKERLMSWPARTRWLPPDLKPLPMPQFPWPGYRPRLRAELLDQPHSIEAA